VDSLILPVFTDEHTLDEAMRRMEATASRAIVVRHVPELADDGFTVAAPEGYMLYMNRAVVGAWAAKERTCASLRAYEGEAVRVLDRWATPASPCPLEQLIEGQLDQLGAELGVVFPTRPEDDTVVIVTRYEARRRTIVSAPIVCACTGPSRHMEDSPPATEGGGCDTCGNPYSCR
jgi:hypothetical protein